MSKVIMMILALTLATTTSIETVNKPLPHSFQPINKFKRENIFVIWYFKKTIRETTGQLSEETNGLRFI